jgi:hypothetical protein
VDDSAKDSAKQNAAHQPGAERPWKAIQASQPEPTQVNNAALPTGPPKSATYFVHDHLHSFDAPRI